MLLDEQKKKSIESFIHLWEAKKKEEENSEEQWQELIEEMRFQTDPQDFFGIYFHHWILERLIFIFLEGVNCIYTQGSLKFNLNWEKSEQAKNQKIQKACGCPTCLHL